MYVFSVVDDGGNRWLARPLPKNRENVVREKFYLFAFVSHSRVSAEAVTPVSEIEEVGHSAGPPIHKMWRHDIRRFEKRASIKIKRGSVQMGIKRCFRGPILGQLDASGIFASA